MVDMMKRCIEDSEKLDLIGFLPFVNELEIVYKSKF